MSALISAAARTLWSAPTLFALFAVFFSISRRAGFPQRRIFGALRGFVRRGGLKALGVPLPAVLGVGNITGMAAAVCLGGPGAVFWCFLAGLLGSGVQYAECLVGIKKKSAQGVGAMYLLRAQGSPRTAAVYAAAVCLCGLLIGAAIPSGAAVQLALPGLSPEKALACGASIALLSAAVILGGRKRVQSICAKIVPWLVLFYLALLAAILLSARGSILSALRLILREAFALRPAVSGLGGYGAARAMHWGTARGLFSSEAGMGTAAIAAQTDARSAPEARAAQCACCAVIDTVLLSSLTGLAFTAAALETGAGFSDASGLMRAAFSLVPAAGGTLVTLCVGVLAFSTILGWYCIASCAHAYLFPGKKGRVLTLFWIFAVLAGPIILGKTLWEICDIATLFLLVPNLTALWRERSLLSEGGTTCT